MSLRFDIAKAVGAVSTWGLRTAFHRPAENFPGKAALYIDPTLIADLKPRLSEGSVVVVGTNGKTTVTNLLADAFEAAGKTVACNRTGANLDSGLATSLLHVDKADWGVFESDELWLAKSLPQLQADYVVLLNLFRDQLDRMGEIDHIQAAIAGALDASPESTLIYNADDPLCQAIAERVSNKRVSFGLNEDLGLPQNSIADASMCQCCDSLLNYTWRQYGQLGSFQCPTCGFTRVQPDYAGCDVALGADGASFNVQRERSSEHVITPFEGAYMLYNVLAVYVAADCCGVAFASVDRAIQAYSPHNGRLQAYQLQGRRILLNLAKNPTGFNQNLRIVASEPGPKAVAFFINDREADGHDVSWLWDVDFQELAGIPDLTASAGGIRRNDMQLRLKHADIHADLIDDAEDFLGKAAAESPDTTLFLIANYTALPGVKAGLDRLCVEGHMHVAEPVTSLDRTPEPETACEASPATGRAHVTRRNAYGRMPASAPSSIGQPAEGLTIVHLYPELLNLYGDAGNVTVLVNRARWRGLKVDVVRVRHGDEINLSDVDIVFLGGGPDREQRLASRDLIAQAHVLRDFVEDDGALLAICGGYQILGTEWLLNDESVPGLGILDLATKRAEGGSRNRLVGNIALESSLARMPVVGYENHAGRTYLGDTCVPFGRVIGKHGKGNNDDGIADGVLYRNVIGTYLHGPVLSKNPEIADWLIERALARRAAKAGVSAPALQPLDDSIEEAANGFMFRKLY